MNITIDLTDRLAPALRGAVRALSDLTEPMALVAEAWLERTETGFLAQRAPDGTPWQQSQNAITGKSKATLFQSGSLYNALDNSSGSDFAEIGVQATGGPARYARIHNEGGVITPTTARALNTPFGPRKSVTIPQRQFIGAAPEDIESAVDIISEHVQGWIDRGADA